ncbi:MAG: AAA family ATPase [Thermodesulfobacteriota bacterium]
MAVITISRGSYSKGKEIAEKLAGKLKYECISREIILEASEQFNIPEVKLIRAIHDAPSVLERFTHGKEKFIAHIRRALLAHVAKDNIVYHGLAGHFFLRNVPHILKVRIIANLDDRVREEMKRENIPEDQARYLLRKDDEERRKWSLHLFGIDAWDPSLYDVVLHIDSLGVDDAVDILFAIARRPCFQTTPESAGMLQDLVLAASVQAALVNQYPTARVSSVAGAVLIQLDAPFYLQVAKNEDQERKLNDQVNALVKGIDGIQSIRLQVAPSSVR